MVTRMEGKRVIVTGAASGIGKATAELLGHHGAQLALIDRSADELKTVADALSCRHFQLDLSVSDRIGPCINQAVEFMGGVDVVINVAGITKKRMIEEMTDDDWNELVAINLSAPYKIIQAAVPHLRKAKAPAIVNVSSGTALLPSIRGYSAYAATKGGLVTLSKALAYELAPAIRVNAVCPGSTLTAMMTEEGRLSAISENSPYALQRSAEPIEVAHGILYLSSEESSYVTGTALAIDGGRTFH